MMGNPMPAMSFGMGALSGGDNKVKASGGRIGMKRGGAVGDDFLSTVHSIRHALRGGGRVLETERGDDGVYHVPTSSLPRSGVAEGGPYNTGGGGMDPFRVAPPMWGPGAPNMGTMPVRQRFDAGGAVGGVFGALPGWGPGEVPMGWNDGEYDNPNARVAGGFADAMPPPMTGDPAASPYSIPLHSIPLPPPRPGQQGLPPEILNPGGEPIQLPPSALGYAGPPANGPAMTQGAPPMGLPPQAPPMPPQGAAPSGGGLFGMSEEARMGLISAGLGMMASRSPFALNAIGEGGLQGVKTYSSGVEAKRKTESEARRLAQQAQQFAQTLGVNRERLGETQAHNRATETHQRALLDGNRVPAGFERNPEGGVRPMTGGPADPDHLQRVARARQNNEVSIDGHTLTDMADQYLAGDKSVFQNLGRGAQGSANIVALRQRVAERAREANLTPDQIATKMADFAGRTAAMRSLGTRGVNVEYAANTANRAIDIAEQTMLKVPRTQFVPLNQLRQLIDNKTSSPEQAAFYAATNTLVNEYARVASGGSNQATEGMRHHAREMLNTAMGPAAYKAVLDTMRQEIMSAKAAYDDTRKEFLEDRGGSHGAPGAGAVPGAPPRGGAAPVRVKSIEEAKKLKSGTKFIDPNGVERTVP